MARDGLAALARLRRLETVEAKRKLALQLSQEAVAAERLATAAAALQEEHAADAAAWRLWLPRGLAERERAALARDHAAARRGAAQAGLAECRAAERAVELLRERRAAEARRGALRRAQALLDEAAQRRRAESSAAGQRIDRHVPRSMRAGITPNGSQGRRRAMRGMSEGWRWAMLATALLGPAALAQPAPQTAPPDRSGPVWDFRDHDPTPAEIQARERARGMPQTGQPAETQEVDQLYRELLGSDPKAPPPSTSRERDRR